MEVPTLEELAAGQMCPQCATVTQGYLSHTEHEEGVARKMGERWDSAPDGAARWHAGAKAGTKAGMGSGAHTVPCEPECDDRGFHRSCELPADLLALGELGERNEHELYRSWRVSHDGNRVGLGWSARCKRFYFYLYDKQGAAWGSTWELPLDYQRELGIPVVFKRVGLAPEVGGAGSAAGGSPLGQAAK